MLVSDTFGPCTTVPLGKNQEYIGGGFASATQFKVKILVPTSTVLSPIAVTTGGSEKLTKINSVLVGEKVLFACYECKLIKINIAKCVP
jgi:hypothetical protein